MEGEWLCFLKRENSVGVSFSSSFFRDLDLFKKEKKKEHFFFFHSYSPIAGLDDDSAGSIPLS